MDVQTKSKVSIAYKRKQGRKVIVSDAPRAEIDNIFKTLLGKEETNNFSFEDIYGNTHVINAREVLEVCVEEL